MPPNLTTYVHFYNRAVKQKCYAVINNCHIKIIAATYVLIYICMFLKLDHLLLTKLNSLKIQVPSCLTQVIIYHSSNLVNFDIPEALNTVLGSS